MKLLKYKVNRKTLLEGARGSKKFNTFKPLLKGLLGESTLKVKNKPRKANDTKSSMKKFKFLIVKEVTWYCDCNIKPYYSLVAQQ